MFKLSHFYPEDMALALVVWVCSLPLIALIVVPLFGSRVALFTAILLLILVMVVCWGICGWKLVRGEKGRKV